MARRPPAVRWPEVLSRSSSASDLDLLFCLATQLTQDSIWASCRSAILGLCAIEGEAVREILSRLAQDSLLGTLTIFTSSGAIAAGPYFSENIADASYLLIWRFLTGPEPPSPFPECGGDVTADAVEGCPGFAGCQ